MSSIEVDAMAKAQAMEFDVDQLRQDAPPIVSAVSVAAYKVSTPNIRITQSEVKIKTKPVVISYGA